MTACLPRRLPPTTDGRGAQFALLAAVAAVAAALYVGWPLPAGFPVDDAWIHMVYGAALRDEGALAYNSGHPATGCTSPLWAALDGLAHALAGRPTPSAAAVAWVKVFGVALHAAGAALAALLARACAPRRRWRSPCAAAAGLLVAAAPMLAFSAVSGMEVPLAVALTLGAFLAASRDAHRLAGLLAGASVAARPECAAALPLVLAWAAHRERAPRPALAAVAAAAAPVALLVLRTLAASGRPLPATFYAKASFARRGVLAALHAGARTLWHATPAAFAPLLPLALAALALGVAAAWRGARAPARRGDLALRPALLAGGVALYGAAYAVGSALSMYAQIPEHFYFQRYLLPALPALLVGAVAGAAGLLDALARCRWHGLPAAAALAALTATALVGALAALPATRRVHREAIANVNAVQVGVGRWIAAHLPQDAIVWSVDAGGPRYWGRRRVVDIMALNTPELVAGRRVAEAWGADAVVVVPTYFVPVAAPGRLAVAATLRSPFADYAARRGGYTQVIFRCVEGAPPDARAELFVVDRQYGTLVAAGRCRRR